MYTKYITALLAAGAAATPFAVEKREALSAGCASKLRSLGVQSGANKGDSSGGVWIGGDGPYTMKFQNNAKEEICLVAWGTQAGYQSSFVGTVAPLVTVSIPPGGMSDVVLSFADGQSGAFAGIRKSTTMSQYGQIYQTWGEFTMSSMGVVDVSREVNPNGDHLRIKTPSCTTTMNKCVFKCVDESATTCGEAGTYQLIDCDAGSQPGAQSSQDGANGGCGWEGASSAEFLSTFH